MYLNNTATQHGVPLHFTDIIGKEQHLWIADIRNQREVFTLVIHTETSICDIVFFDVTPCFQIRFPRSSKGRIGEHKVKGLSGKTIVRDSRTKENIICLRTLAFNQHITAGNCIGLVGVLLTIKMDGYFLVRFLCYFLNTLFSNGQHATCSTGPIIDAVGCTLNFILYRHKRQIGNQFYNITRGKMASGISNIGFFVEFTDYLFKHRSHGMVIQCRLYNIALCIVHRTV